MSITGLSEPDNFHKQPFHLRTDSGELDVFEAARYFSGGATETFAEKIKREEKQSWRVSLDMPHRNSNIPFPSHHTQNGGVEKKIKEKKHKQPSSPGGRLASFLNSLFNQTSSKVQRKSKSKSTTQSMKDENESPGGRRKRRSSISHFRSSSIADSKSVYSSSSSGFRTPPVYSYTPTKTYKDFRSYSDHKPVGSLSKYSNINYGHVKSSALQNEVCDEKRSNDYAWLDEKFKFTIGFPEKKRDFCNGFSEKDGIWADKYPSEEKEFRNFIEVDDDGGDSDSSSDLFELQNCDLGYYSSDLPVYETTHMDTIKRGAPISNAQK